MSVSKSKGRIASQVDVARVMPDGRVNPADARFGWVTTDEVLFNIQNARNLLAYIEAATVLARDQGFARLHIDGVTKFNDVLKQLKAISRHVSNGYLSAASQRVEHHSPTVENAAER